MGGAGRRGEISSGHPAVDPQSAQPLPASYTPYTDSGSEAEDQKQDNHIRIPRHQRPIEDIEVWFDYWSEEVVTTYHILVDQCQQQGYAFLENCDITKFTQFVYENSSKVPPPP